MLVCVRVNVCPYLCIHVCMNAAVFTMPLLCRNEEMAVLNDGISVSCSPD